MADNIYRSDGTPLQLPQVNVNPILTEGTPIASINGKVLYAPSDGGGGEPVVVETVYTLADIAVEGSKTGYYVHTDGRILSAANCIVTKPFLLKVGDVITCSTGGTGISVLSMSNSITGNRVDSVVAATTSFLGTIETEGYYVFSGRINRQDDTNLVVEVHRYTTDNPLEELEERVDVLEHKVNGISGASSALSLGVLNYMDEIPSYWFGSGYGNGMWYDTYLENKIHSVPQGKHFIFITDVHYTLNKKHSAALLDYIRRRMNIKTIIHGGDVENEATTKEAAAKQWLDFNEDYVFRIGSDFKQVCGDHDHNASSGHEPLPYEFVQEAMNGYNINELHYDTLYDERIATYGWSASEMAEYEAWKKMHYYYDDTTISTRFIVLHTGWPGDVGLIYTKIGEGAQSETGAPYLQMDFLYHALMTVPNGYNVVVCGHNVIGNKYYRVDEQTMYNLTEPVWKGSWQQVSKMLRAFIHKTVSPSITYRDWDGTATKTKVYDYSEAPTANIVFCIGGDVHWDIMAKAQTSLETLANVTNGSSISKTEDIAHIVVMTDGADRGYKSYPNGDAICPSATAGTLDEQAFDIVTLNDKGIFFTRIGCGSDRSILFSNS